MKIINLYITKLITQVKTRISWANILDINEITMPFTAMVDSLYTI